MSEEGFLARWSRRKRAAEAGRPAAEPEAPAPVVVVPPAGAVSSASAAPASAVAEPAGRPSEPAFDLASLPPVESLTAESDITAFLRKGVPEALKRAALRRAWALDPAIRDFVGPADYAWDFNAPDGVPGFGLELPGDVGKLLAQALGLEERAAEAPPRAGPDDQAEPAASPPPVLAPTRPEAPVAIAEAAVPETAETAPRPPRRHGSALPS